MKSDKNTLFQADQMKYALGQSFVKLNPASCSATR